MAYFKVVERQVRLVAYYVKADDADMAKEHVQMLGANEFDEEIEIDGTDIVSVEITDIISDESDADEEGECTQHRDSGRGVCIDCGEFLPTADGENWR